MNSAEHLPAVPFSPGSLPWVPFAVSPGGFAGCWRESNSSFSNRPSRAHKQGTCGRPTPASVAVPPRELAGCSVLASRGNPRAGRCWDAVLPCRAHQLLQAGRLSPAHALLLFCVAPRQPWALHQPWIPCQPWILYQPWALHRLCTASHSSRGDQLCQLSADTEIQLLNSWV